MSSFFYQHEYRIRISILSMIGHRFLNGLTGTWVYNQSHFLNRKTCIPDISEIPSKKERVKGLAPIWHWHAYQLKLRYCGVKESASEIHKIKYTQRKLTRNFSLLIVILVACKEMLCIIAISRTTLWENSGCFYASITSSSRWLGRAKPLSYECAFPLHIVSTKGITCGLWKLDWTTQ